ncbi:hypothetical protein MCUN1_003371 [Malassezia cuniculi]|uniref:Sacsin/Nov domain-containing protein n=1 Tax=Malassezia cuniculi TaxID=948313 RepID=A0AAF0EYC0_9BASI|nr:hypothetical protein MCUN1_003371 [Malassezia cuniculi]
MALALAQQALRADGRDEEAITVNQRALIDKILARYSAEFTVFRELLQNADDAGASECELRFSTGTASLTGPDASVPLTQWVFRNNGKPFSGDDWHRLRRIAEGNPDPERIGAFGVGFYSLFSVCEEPIVASGDQLLGFFWKGDALYTRRANAPPAEPSSNGAPWTTFFMSLREPTPFPESPLALCRFLATSLTFTAGVRKVALYLDDVPLVQLEKTVGQPGPMAVSRHLDTRSPGRLFTAGAVDITPVRIHATVSQLVLAEAAAEAAKERPSFGQSIVSAFKSGAGLSAMLASAIGIRPQKTHVEADAPTEPQEASLHMRVARVPLRVSADAAFSREIERSTKKRLPHTAPLQIVFGGKDELKDDGALANRVFRGIAPRLEEQGRVFIGFRTHQTTAFSGHLAARFIPTVERESLDLVDRYCARWNTELLAMGAYLARAIYEAEISALGTQWESLGHSQDVEAEKQRLFDAALYTMRFFSFLPSSPATRVCTTLEDRFFACCSRPCISLLSTTGVRSSDSVRLPSAMLAGFVRDIPVIPPAHLESAEVFITQLRTRHMLRDISMDDVFTELGKRTLSVDEMVACLSWWLLVAGHPSYDPSLLSKLVRSASVQLGEGDETRVQALSDVKRVLNTNKVPSHVVMPPTCLVHHVSRRLNLSELSAVFGWPELTIPEWLEYVVSLDSSPAQSVADAHGLTKSPQNAERVLSTLAWAWGGLQAAQKKQVGDILAPVPCIPTRAGMRRPGEAYFESVSLFPDLAVVKLSQPVKGSMEKLLDALHVRRHVDLQIIFDRLVLAGDWSHMDLVDYLARTRTLLSKDEMDRLSRTPMLLDTAGSRVLPSSLYEPKEELKTLGLPTLAWERQWSSTSSEANLLFELGLRRRPPLSLLLERASAETKDPVLRDAALSYLLNEFDMYAGAYSRRSADKYAFVPSRGDEPLMPPSATFTDHSVAVMGWPIANVSPAAALKLQLRPHPSPAQLFERLTAAPPTDQDTARKTFSFLSTVGDLGDTIYAKLKSAPIIPVNGTMHAPRDCYFMPPEDRRPPQFGDVFTYIDFGPAAAHFLRRCGVSDEPAVEELARKIVADPARIYTACGGTEAYLSVLRRIAAELSSIPRDVRNAMQRSAWLVGVQHQRAGEAESDSPSTQAYALKKPSEICRVDDSNAHMLFAPHVYVTPLDDLLEEQLYAPLGSPTLSSLVNESFSVAGRAVDTPKAAAVLETVLERTPLFLFEKMAASRGEVAHDMDWLRRSLKVTEVGGGGLQLTRTLHYAGREFKDTQHCSAMALTQWGTLHLHIAQNLELDWFEVAQALCKHLLTRQRLQEVLLYMTLLSSPLASLKRKGFNVDKILAQHARAKEPLPVAQIEQEDTVLEGLPGGMPSARPPPEAPRPQAEDPLPGWSRQLLDMFPDADPAYVNGLLRSFSDAHVERAGNKMLEGYPKRATATIEQAPPPPKVEAPPPPNMEETTPLQPKVERAPEKPGTPSGDAFPHLPMEKFRRHSLQNSSRGLLQQLKSRWSRPSSLADGTSSIQRPPQGVAGGPGTSVTTHTQGDTSDAAPEAIQRHVRNAIQAARPDASSVIQSRAQPTEVREASSNYCDVTGINTDLRLAGYISGTKVYVSPELDGNATLANNGAAIQRLIEHVYHPVGRIFGVDLRSLSVFCDVSGPSIAFNRGGSIFLNLRYYLAWHDADVKNGRLSTPLVSVYFTLAHELAHNLVAAHNAEHEFYFSSIAEQYFLSLATYISRAGST